MHPLVQCPSCWLVLLAHHRGGCILCVCVCGSGCVRGVCNVYLSGPWATALDSFYWKKPGHVSQSCDIGMHQGETRRCRRLNPKFSHLGGEGRALGAPSAPVGSGDSSPMRIAGRVGGEIRGTCWLQSSQLCSGLIVTLGCAQWKPC